MGIMLEVVVANDDQAAEIESSLREDMECHGGRYFGTEEDSGNRVVRFLFDAGEDADAALASIDTTSLEVRRFETRVETVDPKDLPPGPIRHASLPDELAALARFSYQRIGNRMYPAYEQWELGFLRDMHPAGEIALWVRMAFAMERYMVEQPDDDEEGVFRMSCRYLSAAIAEQDAEPSQDETRVEIQRSNNSNPKLGGHAPSTKPNHRRTEGVGRAVVAAEEEATGAAGAIRRH